MWQTIAATLALIAVGCIIGGITGIGWPAPLIGWISGLIIGPIWAYKVGSK